ncbi:MAG: 4Fe-4S binding protein [Candidatus Stahlbacteria bacterium]|nr:4Fe-4S binding protein [Candidatus Stahlbacteria bacterium]
MKRRIVQLLGAILPNLYFRGLITGRLIYQGPLKGFCVPTLNCYGCPLSLFACPVGTLQHFIAIRQIPFYIVGYLGIVGTLFGRLACGWICPFGLVQDLLYKIKTFKIKIPKGFRYFKYVVLLGIVILLPLLTQEPWFCKLCPQGGLSAGIPLVLVSAAMRSLVGKLFGMKMIILGVFLFLFIISRCPFCSTICPLGAIYSLFNRISVIKLKIDPTLCNKCEICAKSCPMGVKPYNTHLDCIKCFECKKVCPRNAIKISF